MHSLILILLMSLPGQATSSPSFEAEQIFPPVEPQTHAPGIVECPNGDLLASWYGDEHANDAAVTGARKKKGDDKWSSQFTLADRPNFPDCNTAMSIDAKGRLWLFWPTIIGGSWESAIMNYQVASKYAGPGAPKWEREGLILLKPADFKDEVLAKLGTADMRPPRGAVVLPGGQKFKLADPMYQRMGWASRCKPTVLPSGRILLPLYTDTWSISIMAVSDDAGATWYASKPLIGPGNIQPTVLRRDDGTLVALMRNAGRSARIRVSESKDDGLTWGPVGNSELPNPGSGIDGVRLSNGHWALVYNDSPRSRSTLVVSISEDEGRTWKWTRHLEKHATGRYHYPAVIQGKDGTIHAIYSTFIEPEPGAPKTAITVKGIKHAAFNEEWIRNGD